MSTLVFDGDCAFCTSSLKVMKRLRIRVENEIPWQFADLAALGLTQEECAEKVQWIGDDGRIRSGHEAIAQLLISSGPWKPIGHLLLAPGISWLAEKVYGWVSANRTRLPGGTPACALPPRQ